MNVDLHTILDTPPPAVFHGALVVMLLAGVALWLMGRAAARPLCALVGLLGGAASMLVLGPTIGAGYWVMVMVAGGAVVGCIVAWLLFRFWMGVALALMLAAVVPCTVLLWGEPSEPPPPLDLTIEAPTEALAEELAEALADELADEVAPQEELQIVRGVLARLTAWFDQVREGLVEKAGSYWDGLPDGARRTAFIGAIAGAVVGLVLGLLAPYWSASFCTALPGTLLVFASLGQWVHLAGWQPPDWLWRPESRIVQIGLITGVGMFLQWIIFRPRSD